jgi:hypothetical protein
MLCSCLLLGEGVYILLHLLYQLTPVLFLDIDDVIIDDGSERPTLSISKSNGSVLESITFQQR